MCSAWYQCVAAVTVATVPVGCGQAGPGCMAGGRSNAPTRKILDSTDGESRQDGKASLLRKSSRADQTRTEMMQEQKAAARPRSCIPGEGEGQGKGKGNGRQWLLLLLLRCSELSALSCLSSCFSPLRLRYLARLVLSLA